MRIARQAEYRIPEARKTGARALASHHVAVRQAQPAVAAQIVEDSHKEQKGGPPQWDVIRRYKYFIDNPEVSLAEALAHPSISTPFQREALIKLILGDRLRGCEAIPGWRSRMKVADLYVSASPDLTYVVEGRPTAIKLWFYKDHCEAGATGDAMATILQCRANLQGDGIRAMVVDVFGQTFHREATGQPETAAKVIQMARDLNEDWTRAVRARGA